MPTILQKIKAIWQDADNRDRIMQSVPLRFLCFLRAGEFTVPSDQEFNLEVHLTKDDIMVDNLAAP